jgi:hypothetical protein
MPYLSAIDTIRIWESSQRRPPSEKIIAVLAAASPDKTKDELAQLTLGQCNRRLLNLHEQIFGSRLGASATCPSCGVRLEFELDTDLFRPLNEDQAIDSEFDLTSDQYSVRFRLLNLADLNSANASHSVSAAREQLVQRCVLTAAKGKKSLSAEQLPDEVVSALAARLAECDPEAELLCNLSCPSCGFEFELPFDLSAFFCAEIDAEAQRLLREVHALARGYGWSEAEILEMAAPRRQFYLDMLDQ